MCQDQYISSVRRTKYNQRQIKSACASKQLGMNLFKPFNFLVTKSKDSDWSEIKYFFKLIFHIKKDLSIYLEHSSIIHLSRCLQVSHWLTGESSAAAPYCQNFWESIKYHEIWTLLLLYITAIYGVTLIEVYDHTGKWEWQLSFSVSKQLTCSNGWASVLSVEGPVNRLDPRPGYSSCSSLVAETHAATGKTSRRRGS